jgi:AcrR family transcriptional regulator
VARRKLTLELAPIVAAVAAGPPADHDELLLDATEDLLRRFGLTRWSVDDVAARAGVGRTSVYRRFPSRDDLVAGVLARELRRTIADIARAVEAHTAVDDRLVEAALLGLQALRHSVVDHLLQSDPATILPFLTTGAGPLIELARRAFVPANVDAGLADAGPPAELVAETLARLGLSFVLTRTSVLPADDPEALRAAVRGLLAPMLAGTAWGDVTPRR